MLTASLLALAGVVAAAANPENRGVPIPAPYLADADWTYFRDGRLCKATGLQPAGANGLILSYDGDEKAFAVAFTRSPQPDLKTGDERPLDIRFHRAAGVLDEGWEDVLFLVVALDERSVLMVSQPMSDPAAKDFAEMQAVEFIDRGKKAGFFRMRNTARAVKEMLRCAKDVRRGR